MCFFIMLSPFIFFGIIFYAIRHWEKSTAYFKTAFLCWLITFWGVGFWMLAKYQGSSSSTAGIGYGLAFPYAMLPACAIGFVVWLIGFLIAKIMSNVSNHRIQKRYRYQMVYKFENEKFSLKTVALTYVLTYLGAVGLLLMTYGSCHNCSVGKIFTMFITMSLCFPMGLGYYIEHIESFKALGGWSVLIFFYLIYITLFVLAQHFRGKKAFITILVIWIVLLILNIHGCAKGFADM